MTEKKNIDKICAITITPTETYEIPVLAIALNRAAYFAGKGKFNGDVVRSLKEDTEPLFNSDKSEIIDWAQNNMDWSNVENYTIKKTNKIDETDYQDAWINGKIEIK